MSPPDVNSISANLPLGPSRIVSSAELTTSSQSISPGDSRRTSTVMGPPPLPHNTASPRPPQSATIPPTMERQPSEQGPIRHPRPLTAAELHLELEKEQESIVNRLTRELSALRAQTASVASTASSTSDLFTSAQNLPDPYSHFSSSYSGANIIPTSARRHRSSSNLSTRSARSARDALVRDSATSVSGVAAPRDADRSHGTSARQSFDISRDGPGGRPEGSRQNSYGLSYSHIQNHPYGQGLTTSTSGGSGVGAGPGVGMYRSTSQTASSPYGASSVYPHRTSSASQHHSRNHSSSLSLPNSQSQQNVPSAESVRSPSFGSAQAAARYEEAAIQRQELEVVRRENEMLKQRIRELERLVSGSGQTQVNGNTTAEAA